MYNKSKAIITVGIPASGKSTFASNLIEFDDSYIEVNRDWTRHNIVCPGTNNSTYKFTKERERQVTAECDNLIMFAAEHGRNLIISNTNLNVHHRESLIDLLDSLDYDVEVKLFPISYEEAVKRDNAREHGVGHNIIYKMWLQYVKQFELPKGYTLGNTHLPKAIICDIDGTLAHMNGKRSPYDWVDVGEDSCDPIVKGIVNRFYNGGTDIIIVSGRSDICQNETVKWLHENCVEYTHLFMREDGDNRKDTEVKKEIYFEEIYDKFNVVRVLDDRPCVVRLWNSLGLNVISFADQNKEF